MSFIVGLLALSGLVVVLLIIFLITDSLKKPSLPALLLIEPLALLVKRWQLARFDGQGNQIERTLRLFSQTTAEESLLTQILPLSKGKLPVASLLSARQLSLLGEQRLVEQNGKKFSLIIGLADEVLPQLIVSPTEQAELLKLQDKAGEHGFLALAVGWTAVHPVSSTVKLSSLSHSWLGGIVLDPVVDEQIQMQLSTNPSNKRLLTVLPLKLAEFLAEKIGVEGMALMAHPKESSVVFEQKAQKAVIMAEANQDARHRVIRALQLHHRPQLISRLPGDKQLPITIVAPTTIA